MENKTGIVISHRVSTVKHADEIMFMDEGRIVERGTHEELMELKGMYYTLYKSQIEQDKELHDEKPNDNEYVESYKH